MGIFNDNVVVVIRIARFLPILKALALFFANKYSLCLPKVVFLNRFSSTFSRSNGFLRPYFQTLRALDIVTGRLTILIVRRPPDDKRESQTQGGY